MRPQALAALRGSDLIIHAGDVGNGSILEALKEIAPTLAVKGNVDVKASGLALTALVEAGSALIYVLHDVKELDTDPAALGVHIVVSGPLPQAIANRARRRSLHQSRKRRAATLSFTGERRESGSHKATVVGWVYRTEDLGRSACG
jgi:hypothetical protein